MSRARVETPQLQNHIVHRYGPGHAALGGNPRRTIIPTQTRMLRVAAMEARGRMAGMAVKQGDRAPLPVAEEEFFGGGTRGGGGRRVSALIAEGWRTLRDRGRGGPAAPPKRAAPQPASRRHQTVASCGRAGGLPLPPDENRTMFSYSRLMSTKRSTVLIRPRTLGQAARLNAPFLAPPINRRNSSPLTCTRPWWSPASR